MEANLLFQTPSELKFLKETSCWQNWWLPWGRGDWTIAQEAFFFFGPDTPKMLRSGVTLVLYVGEEDRAPRNQVPLETIRAGYPMEVIAVDMKGASPEKNSVNSYILVFRDYFTKWMEA